MSAGTATDTAAGDFIAAAVFGESLDELPTVGLGAADTDSADDEDEDEDAATAAAGTAVCVLPDVREPVLVWAVTTDLSGVSVFRADEDDVDGSD